MIRSNQFAAGIAKSARQLSFILMISSSVLVQVHGQDLVGDWTSGITAYSNSNCDGDALATGTGSVVYTATTGTSISETETLLSFAYYCGMLGGTIDGDSCVAANGTLQLADYASYCGPLFGGAWDEASSTCVLTSTDTSNFDYTVNGTEYCETKVNDEGASETSCGTIELSDQNATITMASTENNVCQVMVLARGTTTTTDFQPQTKEELQTAVDLWVNDNATALTTYGEINTWDVSLITDMSWLFKDKSTFNDDIGNWDVSNVTTMLFMFKEARDFNQDLNNWDVSSVSNMQEMFKSAHDFNGNISSWNVTSVSTMRNMFWDAQSFNSDITNWDVSNATNLFGMFVSAPVFNQDISSWDVSNNTNFVQMFANASSFNQDISGWNVSSGTAMDYMFYGSPFNQNISSWDVSNVATTAHMFQNATNFDQDISSWNVSNVTRTFKMFNGASSFDQDVSGWNVENVTDFAEMFDNAGLSELNKCNIHTSFSSNGNWPYDWSGFCETTTTFQPQTKAELQTAVNLWVSDNSAALTAYGEINTWDVSLLTDMSDLFSDKNNFNSDISNWDVSNVTNMNAMFDKAHNFNSDISNWDVSSVTTMTWMFHRADDFNGDLSDWNVGNVTDMFAAFHRAWSFNSDLTNWDVSNVTRTTSMFYDASSFNGDVSNWNVSNVTSMDRMFYQASSFNQNLSNWDVSNVSTIHTMFADADLFNGDISTWDVSNVTEMNHMFTRAANFNGNISAWDVSNVTTTFRMFLDATAFNQDISGWNVDSVTNMDGMFDNAGLSELNKCNIHTSFSSNGAWPYDWSGFCETTPGLPQTGNILGHYPFNGDADDVSGNGNNGVIEGGVSLSPDMNGNDNSAYYFDGTEGTRIFADGIYLAGKSHTISFLAQRDITLDRPAAVISHGLPQDGSGVHVFFNADHMDYNFWGRNLRSDFNSDTYANNWHHYVVSYNYDENVQKIYLDGALAATGNPGGNIYSTDGGPLVIGSMPYAFASGLYEWKGHVDDVIVWDTELTEEEVSSIDYVLPTLVDVTFNVDMTYAEVGDSSVYVAGGNIGFDGYLMSDGDNDGVYSVTVSLEPDQPMFHYKYRIGRAAPDWTGMWEDGDNLILEGCGDPNVYGDRHLNIGTESVVLDPVCFSSCSPCENVSVTFNLDIGDSVVSDNGIHVAGSFNGWETAGAQMTDEDGDGIYSYTAQIAPFTTHEYKFINGNTWDDDHDSQVPSYCALENGNRFVHTVSSDFSLSPVCINSCIACYDAPDLTTGIENFDDGGDLSAFWHTMNNPNADPAIAFVEYDVSNNSTDNSYAALFDYSVHNSESWGGFSQINHLHPDYETGGSYDWSAYNTLNFDYFVEEQYSGEEVILRIILSDYAGVTTPAENGWGEDHFVFLDILGHEPGWNSISIPMLTTNNWNSVGFTWTGWSGVMDLNQQLDLDQVVGFRFEFSIAGGGEGNHSSGSVVVDNVSLTNEDYPEEVNVTFNFDLGEQEVSPNGVHVAGSFNGWDPAAWAMTDDDSDGIYSYTAILSPFTYYEYKYVNGSTWDEPHDQSVPGECSNPEGNRVLYTLTSDILLDPVCMNACIPCTQYSEVDVTFNVDMSQEEVGDSLVYLAGGAFGFDGYVMNDDDMDGVYTVTVPVAANSDMVHYKFRIGTAAPDWSGMWENGDDLIAQGCGNPDSWGDRYFSTGEESLVLDTVCFGSCSTCTDDPHDGDNMSIAFDGQDDFIDFPDGIISGVYNFTIETWVNVSSFQVWQRIVDFGSGAGNNMFLTSGPGTNPYPRFVLNNGSGEQIVDSSVPIEAGEWYHIAITLNDDNHGKMYINGELVGENTNMTQRPADIGNGNTTNNWLGKSQYGADANFHGFIDEVRIWDFDRSQEDIQTHMNFELGGNEPGLINYWNFNHGEGDIVHDLAGGDFNGSLTNGAEWSSNVPGLEPGFDCGSEIDGFTFVGGYEGSCYYMSDYTLFWDAAKLACEEAGGHLATITSDEERSHLVDDLGIDLTINNWGPWIGLSDHEEEGDWRWVSGEPLDYTNWAAGQPGIDSPENNATWSTGGWHDHPNSRNFNFILEIPGQTTPTDTTVYDLTWSVQIRASVGEYIDDFNYVGVAPNATDGFDSNYDELEPPLAPGNSVNLYFHHPEWNNFLGDNFSSDIKPEVGLEDTMQVWDFHFWSTNNGEAMLDFDAYNVVDLPMILEDLGTGERFHLGDGPSHSFVAVADSLYHFRLSVGDVTPPELELGSSFHGPAIYVSDYLYQLYWMSSDGFWVDSVMVMFSDDGGATFVEELSTNEPVNILDWTAPDAEVITGAMFKVVLKDYAGNVTEKMSDHMITIAGHTLTTNISTGWTLWGAPINPDNDSMEVNLGDDFSDYWDTFDYVDNGYTYNGVLKASEGYWLGSTEDATIDVTGMPIDFDYSVNLSLGWDLVSNPLVIDVSADSLLFIKDGNTKSYNEAVGEGWVNSIYGYNGSGYEIATHLTPWSGYWISVIEQGVEMVMPIHAPSTGHGHRDRDRDEGWSIAFEAQTDGASDNMMIIGYSETATDIFDTEHDALKPPIPPGPAYVSLFTSHPEWEHPLGSSFTKDIRSEVPAGGYQEWVLSVESSEQMINVSWSLEAMPDEYEIGFSNDGGQYFEDMRSFSSLSLSAGSGLIVRVGTMVLGLAADAIPVEFALKQNYPNPFNPTTQIEYQLPVDEVVSIAIYDVMGRKVRSLVNGIESAGYKSVTWDATNELGLPVAAGMYIYTIETGSFRQMKKMVLLK